VHARQADELHRWMTFSDDRQRCAAARLNTARNAQNLSSGWESCLDERDTFSPEPQLFADKLKGNSDNCHNAAAKRLAAADEFQGRDHED
jgi:hypothetical protein